MEQERAPAVGESTRVTTVQGNAHEGEPLVQEEQSLEVVEGGVRRTEVKSLARCKTCGFIFHDPTQARATCCACGGALCEQDAAIHCSDTNCGGSICAADRRRWNESWYCRQHYGGNVLGAALACAVVVLAIYLALERLSFW